MPYDKSMRVASILLVEDNPGDAELTKEALEASKFHNKLYIVEDGEEAMKFLYKKPPYQETPTPDIIFLDLNLPKKDGREVLQEIKKHPQLKRIPVVVLTTSKAETDIIKSYDLHANCYITKPLDLQKFLEVVQSIKTFWMSIVILPPKIDIDAEEI